MNGRGQIVLPIEFRRKLDLVENCEFQVFLNPDGGIELRPVILTPVSYFVENDSDLRDRFKASMEQVEKGEVLSEEETRRLFLEE